MRIVWDEEKRRSNFAKHGLDFAWLDIRFFRHSVILPARDARVMAIGRLDTNVVTVIFTRLGTEAISVISMRRASRRERANL